jgi:hypothetical protein
MLRALARATRTHESIELPFSEANTQCAIASLTALPLLEMTASGTKPAHCITERQSFSARPSRCECRSTARE